MKNMKTVILMILVVVLSMSLVTVSAFADSPKTVVSAPNDEVVGPPYYFTFNTRDGYFEVPINVYVGYNNTISGPYVEATQAALRDVDINYSQFNCDPGGKPDGLFGPLTYNAIVNFQYTSGLSADGIAGPNTFRELEFYVYESPNNW